MLNHSCQPNCVATFRGPVVQIRAIRSIEKDEEVFDLLSLLHVILVSILCHQLTMSYIELLQPIAHRRKVLQDQYNFLCVCPGCTSEEVTFVVLMKDDELIIPVV